MSEVIKFIENKESFNIIMPQYRCPTHGEIGNAVVTTKKWQEPEINYCAICYIELIEKHCCEVEKINND